MNKPTYRPKDDQNLWNFIFSLFFILILGVALWALYMVRGDFPTNVPIFDAILIAFASFRLTRLIVYDKITRFFREWFVNKREITRDGETWVEMSPVGRGFRHTAADLLNCPWCIGLWAGLIASFFYFLFPWTWFIIFFLAASGAGSLLQLLGNLLGWRAENLKLDAHTKEKGGATSDRSGI